MSAEGPFLAHTHCVAGSNMSSTASLYGPNGSGQFLFVKMSASLTVVPAAANTDVPVGVAQNDPITGQPCEVVFSGVTKVVAGAAVSAGAMLMSDTGGRAITQTSTNPSSGIALEAATAANQVIRMQFTCSNGAPG